MSTSHGLDSGNMPLSSDDPAAVELIDIVLVRTIALSLCLYRQQNIIEAHIHRAIHEQKKDHKTKSRQETHDDFVPMSVPLFERERDSVWTWQIEQEMDMHMSNEGKRMSCRRFINREEKSFVVDIDTSSKMRWKDANRRRQQRRSHVSKNQRAKCTEEFPRLVDSNRLL